MLGLAVPIREFVRDPWLMFDVLVIIGGWVDIVLNQLNVRSINTNLFRLFRVARLMKFVGKGGKDLRVRCVFAEMTLLKRRNQMCQNCAIL